MLVWVVLLIAGAGASAQGIPAAGDKDDIWLLRKSGIDDVIVYHRNQSDHKDAQSLYMVSVSMKSEGRPSDNVIAAGPSGLWMIKPSGWVESFSINTGIPRYGAPRSEQKLPDSVKPVTCAAARNGFWVLVRIDNAQDFKRFEAQMNPAPAAGSSGQPGSDLPPWFVIRGLGNGGPITMPDDIATTAPVVDRPVVALQPAVKQDFPVYRVLHLEGSVWRAHPAPKLPDAPQKETEGASTRPAYKQGAFGMLFLRQEDAWPQILYQTPGVGITRSRWINDRWETTVIDGADAFDKAIVVDHQAVIVRAAKAGGNGASLYLGVISGDEVIDLPKVDLASTTGDSWAVVPMDNAIAIIQPLPGQAIESELDWKLSLKRINLLGQTVGDTQQTLESKPANLWNDSPNMVIFASSFFVGLLLMWSLWGRDNVETSVRLPVGVVKADLPRRAFACLIDLVPCAWVSMLIYKVEFGELFKQIIELQKTWGLLKPWLVTVAILAVYSTLCEIFYGRTLGKYLAGLRVTRLDASAPGALQIIIRNAVKIIEVLCFPLMFIPVARLNAQRLGDMAARTIVVADEPPEEEDDDDFDGN